MGPCEGSAWIAGSVDYPLFKLRLAFLRETLGGLAGATKVRPHLSVARRHEFAAMSADDASQSGGRTKPDQQSR
jgi:hypothetical protein